MELVGSVGTKSGPMKITKTTYKHTNANGVELLLIESVSVLRGRRLVSWWVQPRGVTCAIGIFRTPEKAIAFTEYAPAQAEQITGLRLVKKEE